MTMMSLSRRELLKLAGSAAAAAAVLPLSSLLPVVSQDRPADPDPSPTPLGRVAEISADIRVDATRKSKLVRIARRDEVLTLIGQVAGQAVMAYNNIWFQTDEGYVYSSWVQPVQNTFNTPEPDKAADKFWAEVTVPITDARAKADPKSGRGQRLYYSTVYHVIDAVQGTDKNWWYRVQEGVSFSPGPYVRAGDLRRIDPSEMTPLSPDITDKRVEVNLKKQTITAFENGNAVKSHLVCSGYGAFGTPRGKHKVLFKTPTSRMIGGSGTSYYDLPGVPFCTFFTWSGIAIHGTYWHNDYGRPRSHGCVNVPSDVAMWFWRWTMPAAPYEKRSYYTQRGDSVTQVIVS
jgi:L,D-transpeptidase catalytic domain